MRRMGRAARLSLASAALVISGVVGILSFASTASADAALTVTPSTGLSNGTVVQVAASGYPDNATGAVLECNSDPNQPTISFAGNDIPVSCSNPLNALKSTNGSGDLAATSFTIAEGTVGPPAAGTPTCPAAPTLCSSTGSAATDAAAYPCPPTPAQVTAGDSCVITYGVDGQATAPTANISFGGGTTTTPSSTTTTTTTTSSSTTPTTSVPIIPTLSATAGGAVVATATGFNSLEPVNVTIESTPVFLAQLIASSVGSVTSAIAIPANTALGAHDLIFTGVDSGHVVTIPLTVVAFPGSSSTGSGSSGGGTVAVVAATGTNGTGTAGTSGTTKTVLANGTLAFTGAGPGVWFMAAGGLLLLNLGFLVLTMYYRPRELMSGAGRRISRIFGAE
jgi:hypothetical protein